MNRAEIWINTIMNSHCSDNFVESLLNNYHIEDVSTLYCVNAVNDIIGSHNKTKDAQLFFATLWECSKNIHIDEFLIGLGFDKSLVDKIINSGYDTLEKIRKVNYEGLISIGVKEKDAGKFLEQMICLSDEMELLLNNKLIKVCDI